VLIVVGLFRTDAHHRTQRRIRAVRGDEQLTAELLLASLSRFDAHTRDVAVHVDIDDAGGAQHLHRYRLRQGSLQDIAEHAVYHHVAERLYALLCRIDMRKPETATVRDVNTPNRCRCRYDIVPQSHRLEHALGAAR
jgi:hypothetical protein